MIRRPLRIALTPGLPPAGSRGQFIGKDADGCLWLLNWDVDGHCWSALGFHLNRPKPWPALIKLEGEHAGFILGWVQGPDPDIEPGRPATAARNEGAEGARRNGASAGDRLPVGHRTLPSPNGGL